jgi:DNA polymerase V
MSTLLKPNYPFAIFPADACASTTLPYFENSVPAGFPSPADDYLEKALNLHELLVTHPAATFFVKVEGESMCDAGIHSGDILVVDRSLEPASGKIVIAALNGEFTVKRISLDSSGVLLEPANCAYAALRVTAEMDFQVWGVVTYVIHRAR